MFILSPLGRYLFAADSFRDNINPRSIRHDYKIYYQYSYYLLSSMFTYKHWTLWPRSSHSFFSICDFSECVTVILNIFTFHVFIHDYDIIDIPPSSFHYIPDLSLCDPFDLFCWIYFRKSLCNNINRVLFTPNISHINVFIVYYVLYKIMTNINVLCTHKNFPLLC